MRITYIIGRAGTGKSTEIVKAIKKRIEEKNDNRLILLVPEQYTLQAERDLIERLDVDGIIRAEVLSFSRLAHYVFKEVGGLTKVKINNLGKTMVLKKVVKEIEDSLTIYKKAINQNGFIDNLNETIKEFKQYNILPIDLINKAEGIVEETLKHKLGDIALIYNAFNDYLKGKYIDNEDHINLLIDSIEGTSFLKGAEIWIDGFHKFTPQDLKIIEKLLVNTKGLTISVTHDFSEGDNNLFYMPQNTLQKLKAIAQNYGALEEVIDLNNREAVSDKSVEINHLEKYIFRFPYKPLIENTYDVHVFAGSNLYCEIENVAIEIINLTRDRDFRYKDIMVVSANMQSYGPIIKRVFSEYGIPIFMDEKRDIMNNQIIELILTTLKIMHKGYQYEDMIRYLKTGFISISNDEIEEIENYVLRYGIKGSLWFRGFTIDGEFDLDKINCIRERIIEPFIQFEESIKGNRSVSEITEALFYFIDNLELKTKLEKLIEHLKIQGSYDLAHENSQIWNIVMEVFSQLSEILGYNKVKLKDYYRIIESGFMACEVGVIPSTVDQVLIGNLDRSRSQNIKALFLVGVNDGVLPGVQDETGIILDHEKLILQNNGISISSSSDTKILEERFNIYSTMTKPSDLLYISYAIADQEGKALRASMLIDQIKKIFPLLKIKSDLINCREQQMHFVTKDSGTFKYLIENLRKYVDREPVYDFWWDVYKWYFENKNWRNKVEKMVSALFHDNQVYYLREEQAKLLYSKPLKSSVSRLETYINCPFAHFINYGLKPKERREYQLRVPDVGKLYHEVIDLFSKRVTNDKLEWQEISQEQCHGLIDDIILEICERFEDGLLYSNFRYKYMITRLGRICKRAIWTLIDHVKMGDFKPWGHEVYFGEKGSISAVEIKINDEESIYLEGRIDRVDFIEDSDGLYYKIIDYKSGDKDFNLSDVYFGFQLQLMVYLEAMVASSQGKAKPGGIFYFKIDDPMINTNETDINIIVDQINKKLRMKGLVLNNIKVIKSIHREIEKGSTIIPVGINKTGELSKGSSAASEEEFKALLGHVRELVRKASQEIIRGNIKIEPCRKGDVIACQYCNFKAICQFDQSFNDNNYKNIKELKNEEVIERLLSKKEGEKNA